MRRRRRRVYGVKSPLARGGGSRPAGRQSPASRPEIRMAGALTGDLLGFSTGGKSSPGLGVRPAFRTTPAVPPALPAGEAVPSSRTLKRRHRLTVAKRQRHRTGRCKLLGEVQAGTGIHKPAVVAKPGQVGR